MGRTRGPGAPRRAAAPAALRESDPPTALARSTSRGSWRSRGKDGKGAPLLPHHLPLCQRQRRPAPLPPPPRPRATRLPTLPPAPLARAASALVGCCVVVRLVRFYYVESNSVIPSTRNLSSIYLYPRPPRVPYCNCRARETRWRGACARRWSLLGCGEVNRNSPPPEAHEASTQLPKIPKGRPRAAA